jgi:hypothetical protein
MTAYTVEVQRSISVQVTVTAETAEAALAIVDQADFELPPRSEWTHKDWSYVVCGEDGTELLVRDC